MNDTVKLQLSAFADSELGPDEVRFLLRRVARQPELAAAWTRYHIAGECLRRQALVPASTDFAARVAAALPAATHRAVDWVRMGLGGAIAASVAVAALVLVRLPAPVASSVTPQLAAVPAQPSAAHAVASTNNYSLLMADPGAPRLNVEPASAVVSSGYVVFPSAEAARQRPFWMSGTAAARPRTGVFTALPVASHQPARAASNAPPAQAVGAR